MTPRLPHRIAAALLVPWIGLAPAAAQEAELDFGTAAHDTAAPIEVNSQRLSVDQSAGVTVFSGDVVIVQGAMRLAADRVEVDYGAGGAPGRDRIRRMIATGGVTAVSGDQEAEATEAVYDVETGRIEMRGDVLLTQHGSAVSGDVLVIDLAEGTGTMEGRVRTLLQPDDGG